MPLSFSFPDPAEIVDTFWRHAGRPSQAQLDTLTGAMNIPASALASSKDGADFPIAMFHVERSRSTFEFTKDRTVRPAVGLIAWDVDQTAQDLVAWSPRDGWAGTWLGRAALLNEFELHQPRIGDHLRAYLNVADWFRAGREGVVVLDRARAALQLEGLTIQAIDIADGIELRKILERPRAKILVPAQELQRAAA